MFMSLNEVRRLGRDEACWVGRMVVEAMGREVRNRDDEFAWKLKLFEQN